MNKLRHAQHRVAYLRNEVDRASRNIHILESIRADIQENEQTHDLHHLLSDERGELMAQRTVLERRLNQWVRIAAMLEEQAIEKERSNNVSFAAVPRKSHFAGAES